VPEPPPLSAVEAAAIQALRDGNDELRRELREERAKASDLRMLLQQAQDAQAAAQAECLRAREEAEYQRAEAQQQIERLKTDFLALWSQLETRVDEQDALRARADELERKLKQADETRQQLEEQKLRLAEDFLRALRDWFHSYPSGELEAVSQAAVAASARGVLDRQLAESELVELARRLKMGPATTKSAALDALVAWLVDRQ
jgi:chromosome segregation ATPase